ncbi:MAG: hypothetical protein IBX55_22430 [Methyloprofundus sp.]|nr:hypothetical protein [Methyloprofundus sp.]
MVDKPIYRKKHTDQVWGCEYSEVVGYSWPSNIRACHVKVNQVSSLSIQLTSEVLNTSWMMELDAGSRRAYDKTVKETAEALVKVFQNTTTPTEVGSEFGEIMVSIGSTKALEILFDHHILPISELWKPQVKQNEGFDFHTMCLDNIINFGEAKFSAKKNPHGKAIDQASGFIEDEKHLRDRVHLVNLLPEKAINNLDHDTFGVVVSFSINAQDPLNILKNAIDRAEEKLGSQRIKSIYLVGVSQ